MVIMLTKIAVVIIYVYDNVMYMIMLTKIAVVIIYVYVYSNHYVVYLKYNFICQLDLKLKKKYQY